jgi:hypothetical protein
MHLYALHNSYNAYKCKEYAMIGVIMYELWMKHGVKMQKNMLRYAQICTKYALKVQLYTHMCM